TPQAEYGIDHSSDRSCEVAFQRCRCFRCIPAPQKLSAIRFMLDTSSSADEYMTGPYGRFIRRPRTAVSEQYAVISVLGLHEKLGKDRMRPVGSVRSESELQIAGEFDMPGSHRAIRDRQTPQLRIVLGGDDDCENGLNTGETAPELGAVRGESSRSGGRRRHERLLSGRPHFVRTQIPQIEIATPAIERCIGSPTCHIELIPATIASAGICHH